MNFKEVVINGKCSTCSITNNNILNVFNIQTYPLGYYKGDTDNLEQYNYPKMFMLNEVNNNNGSLSERKCQKDNNEPVFIINDGNEDSGDDNNNNYNYNNNTTDKRGQSQKRQSSKLSTEMVASNYSKRILQENEGLQSSRKYDESPYILSYNYYHQYSFLTGHYKSLLDKEGELRYPSPVIIDDDIWTTPPIITKHNILKGLSISDELGLILTDPLMQKRFKSIVKEMLIQVSKTHFNKKKIPLSIKAFEPKSFIQSISEYWFYLPKYLNKASNPHISPLERMKYIMSFAISGLYIPNKQLKAFNPLIGETFQGHFFIDDSSSINIYFEQISTYPSISRFLITADKYIISGYFDIMLKNERAGNKITLIIKSKITICFKEINEKIIYMMPHVRIVNGACDKKRGVFFINPMVFVDVKNKLKGIVRFAQNKSKIHQIDGGIFEYRNYGKEYKFSYEKEVEFGNRFEKEKIEMMSTLNGSWLEEVRFDNEVYWNIDRDVPYWIQPEKDCLPSDGRYREDIIWLYRAYHFTERENIAEKYEYYAQKWKEMLEGLQKEEREIKSKNRRKSKIRKSN